MMATSLLAQCLLALAAFASLCLATPRHADLLARSTNPQYWRKPLRCGGWALLTVVVLTAVTTGGWGLGLVSLFGALTPAAFIVIGLATYRPEGVIYILVAGLIGGIWILSAMMPGAAGPA